MSCNGYSLQRHVCTDFLVIELDEGSLSQDTIALSEHEEFDFWLQLEYCFAVIMHFFIVWLGIILTHLICMGTDSITVLLVVTIVVQFK